MLQHPRMQRMRHVPHLLGKSARHVPQLRDILARRIGIRHTRLDKTETNTQCGQLLSDIIVQFASDLRSFGFLSQDQPVCERPDSLVRRTKARLFLPQRLFRTPSIGDVSSDALQFVDVTVR